MGNRIALVSDVRMGWIALSQTGLPIPGYEVIFIHIGSRIFISQAPSRKAFVVRIDLEQDVPNTSVWRTGAASIEPAAPARGGIKTFLVTRPEEVELILPLAREFHAESRYGHIPFSELKFRRVFAAGLDRPEESMGAYVMRGELVVGLVHVRVGDYFLGEGGRMATLHAFYISAAIRHSLLGGKVALRLLRVAMDWARARNVEETHIWSTSGIDAERTDSLLKRFGFKMYGGNYVAAVG